MKWVKANWLIIVLTVVALAALPSMFYVSNKLDKSLRAKVFKDVADDYKAVSDSQVTYSIKSVKQPDTNLLEKKTSVNAILTKAFADARTAITSASSLPWKNGSSVRTERQAAPPAR